MHFFQNFVSTPAKFENNLLLITTGKLILRQKRYATVLKKLARHFIIAMLFIVTASAKGQSISELFSNSGIWADYSQPVSVKTYPEFEGRLANINWADIELAPGVWDWTIFDKDISDHVADNLPVIFMVYTKENAPQWLFSNGVPKVTETNEIGIVTGYSPYYLDEDYNFYFKRMITKVREHLSIMQSSVRSKIVGVQACFGSTGDRIAYKGLVPKQYEITEAQFDSLFKVYSLHYYNEYKNVTPAITVMNNAHYQDRAQYDWINENCPGGWMKCPTMGKGFQLNMEAEKMEWLYDRLNKPQKGSYVRSRCEISGDNLDAGWWTKNKYKNMFAVVTYGIYWGLDWPNIRVDLLMDPKYDSAFSLFNRYTGQKVPGLATNAMCALKDVLDASDTERFPEDVFGSADKSNKSRYMNIQEKYISYGAKLEDPAAAMASEYECLKAAGTNDVGWTLLPGNYERYLRQIDANETSSGYWNVDDFNQDAMYGRFARGFDLTLGKDALYFNVQDDFLRNMPLNGAYPVTIEVTYYDNGNGSWQLYYDAVSSTSKASVNVICGNTKTWKKAKVVLSDAYFGNRSIRTSDFYIKSTGSSNIMFSIVELSRPQQSDGGLITSSLPSFDTVCLNSDLAPKSFVLNANFLNGADVQVGPYNGFTFSASETGIYTSALMFSGYGAQLNRTIYIKINTAAEGELSGYIPVTGGGALPASVFVKATVLNTSPILNANVTNISCYNRRDGVIDLQPGGGIGPFSYEWTNTVQPWWDELTEDIKDLPEADYTVVVKSYAGCSTTKTFSILEPDILITSVSQDSSILCKGGTTTVQVTATGGTLPYSGTGAIVVASGNRSYTVTDARGCSDSQGYTVSNGTISAPSNPSSINGPTTVKKQQTGIVFSVKNPNNSYVYIWTVPSDARITSGQNTSAITATWGNTTGNVLVKAQNSCGTSGNTSKKVTASNYITTLDSTEEQDTAATDEDTIIPEEDTVITEQDSSNASVVIERISWNEQLLIVPNPARDIARLRFYAKKTSAYHIEITDIQGRLLLVKKGITTPGINFEYLNIQQLSAGQYFVTLTGNKGQRQTVKLIKQ